MWFSYCNSNNNLQLCNYNVSDLTNSHNSSHLFISTDSFKINWMEVPGNFGQNALAVLWQVGFQSDELFISGIMTLHTNKPTCVTLIWKQFCDYIVYLNKYSIFFSKYTQCALIAISGKRFLVEWEFFQITAVVILFQLWILQNIRSVFFPSITICFLQSLWDVRWSLILKSILCKVE